MINFNNVNTHMRILISILILLSFAESQAQSNAKKLIGKWNWIEASGGITGDVVTPATQGKKIRIEFTTKGTYREWENEKLVYANPFKVEKAKTSSIEKAVELIKYGSKSNQMQQRISERFEFKGRDTLILIQDCPDCFTSKYVRIK
jgi:hypothetical protein